MLRSFFRAPTAILGLVLLVALIVTAIIAPGIIGTGATKLDPANVLASPGHLHWLGTDSLGRDVFDRALVATRLTLIASITAAGIGAAIGVPLGLAAVGAPKYGRIFLLRLIDSLIAFPALLIALFVAAILGPSETNASIGVGIGLSFSFARVTSTLALSISAREHIAAAKVLGISTLARLVRHVLPNVAETLVITATVAVSTSIVAISSLSFLGLGAQAPQFDWGSMLTNGVTDFYTNRAEALGPAVALAISAIAFGLFGEAVARALNPRLAGQPDRRGGRREFRLFGGILSDRALAARVNGRMRRPTERTSSDPVLSLAHPDRLLDVRDLVVTFPGPKGTFPVVKGISFSLSHGERVGIVGESGSGKTMTAMAIAKLVPHPGRAGGDIELNDVILSGSRGKEEDRLLGTQIGNVFQDPTSSLNPTLRIGVQLTEGALAHRDISRADARHVATRLLTEVGLPTPELQLKKHPHELSGGMRQRVMLAMSLMNEPKLLIADEPTTALDVTIQAQIMDLLAEINQTHNTAVLLISHSLALVSQNCDRVLVMYAGRIVEDITVEQLLQGPRHPYTQGLLKSIPDLLRPRADDLESIPGEAPNLSDPPGGCSFHPRCPLATDICRTETPALTQLDDLSAVACWAVTGEKV